MPFQKNWWTGVSQTIRGWFSWSVQDVAAGASSARTVEAVRFRAIEAAPIIWMLGKVQSGKSSIVQRLTRASEAEVGEGFRPMTKTARIFDFPPEAPVVRFLDTRGLGETGYDPAEDIAASERQAQLLLVVLRAGDPAQDAVFEATRAIRARHPAWPVVVAQTWLHALYPFPPSHPEPYPFDSDGLKIPDALARALTHQRQQFGALGGTGAVMFVPLDFTRPDDGLAPPDYGLDALLAALSEALPSAVMARIDALHADRGGKIASEARSAILGYAVVAGAADALPIVAIAAVPAVQGAMLRTLGSRFSVEWTAADIGSLLGAVGTAALVRQGIGFALKQAAKLIPVYGQIGGAAAASLSSFAFTYALGYAACVYLKGRRTGVAASTRDIQEAYREALVKAFDIFRASQEPAK
nr:GTPase [uncultured Rhodopila sp.]